MGLQDGRFVHQVGTEMEDSPYTVLHTILYRPQYIGHYMYHQIWYYGLPTLCMYVFCVDLGTNCDYFTNTALTEWLKALSQSWDKRFGHDSVRLPAWNNSAPAGLNFVEFYIGDCY